MKELQRQPRGAAAPQRVRYDPTRQKGNENALAKGLDMSVVAVMSDQELQRIRRIAYDDDGAAQAAQRSSEESRRKQCSQARSEHWPGTAQAELTAFYAAQAKQQDEAQRRLQELDELHRVQQEARRQAVCDRALLQRLRDDPRGRHAQDVVHLHEVRKDNEQMVARRADESTQRTLSSKMERDNDGVHIWGDATDALQQKLERRERNVAEKMANLSMLNSQKEQRRTAKAAERDTVLAEQREESEAASADEAESAARKREQLLCDAFNRAHAHPFVSHAQRLQQRIESDREVQSALAQEEAKSEKMRNYALEQIHTRRDALLQRQGAALQTWREVKTESDRTQHAQCAFTRPGVSSFLDRIESGCQTREGQQQLPQKECRAVQSASSSQAVNRAAKDADAGDSGLLRHRRAAAAAVGGFLSVEEENAYVAEMKLHPARILEEERAAAAARRARAVRLAEEQRLQAEAKCASVQREREELLEQRMLDESRAAQEEDAYRAYLEKQLPADIPPVLRKKALQVSR